MNNLEKTGANILEVTAYGDAAGLPVETWTHAQIKAHYGWLNRLEVATNNPFFDDLDQAGVWSDDTQLSIAVAEALTESNGFDIYTQAGALVKAYEQSPKVVHKGALVPRGWGGSTTNAAKRLAAGASPLESGEIDGMGNGVVMKLAPLVYWQSAKNMSDTERYRHYDALTTLTHNSDLARWATRVHGDVLCGLLRGVAGTTTSEIAHYIQATARKHEALMHLADTPSSALRYLSSQAAVTLDDVLNNTDGKGFYVPQTLAMAYGVFLQHPSSLERAIYAAVNLGGDTDSIASIVANMVNFYKQGDITLPSDADKLLDRQRLQLVSEALTAIAIRGVK